MKYLLVGNYGVGNLGDEALKDYFLRSYPGVDWLCTSAHPTPKELPRFPGGIRSLLKGEWKRTFNALSFTDGVVFGGGSLFTDVESVRACFLWWMHTVFCRLKRKPYLLAFQGIGPFRTSLGEWFSKSAVKHARFVSVRDESSFLRIQSWNMSVPVIRSFDPVLSSLQIPSNPASDIKICALIPRNNSGSSFCDRAKELLAKGDWHEVHILSLQPEDAHERELCEALRTCVGIPTYVFTPATMDELVQRISVAEIVLSQRYHGALVALALGKRTIVCPQGKDDKLSSLQAIALSDNKEEQMRLLYDAVRNGEDALKDTLVKVAMKKP